jgi:endonuclease YncB( thermonuclease family)
MNDNVNELAEQRAVAQTILDQLGGGRFRFMVGAKQALATPTGLSVRFTAAGGRVNLLLVDYDRGADLYDVTLARVRDGKTMVVQKASGLFAEDLAPWFRERTGLETRLPVVNGL